MILLLLIIYVGIIAKTESDQESVNRQFKSIRIYNLYNSRFFCLYIQVTTRERNTGIWGILVHIGLVYVHHNLTQNFEDLTHSVINSLFVQCI